MRRVGEYLRLVLLTRMALEVWATEPPVTAAGVPFSSPQSASMGYTPDEAPVKLFYCEDGSYLSLPADLLTKATLASLSNADTPTGQTNPCVGTPARSCYTKMEPECSGASTKYRTLDGSCNNLLVPSRGKSGTTYGRFLRPDYGDALGAMRDSHPPGNLPSPRWVSSTLHAGAEGLVSTTMGLRFTPSILVSAWTQLLAEDLSLTQRGDPTGPCCPQDMKPPPPLTPEDECQPIDLSSDPFYLSVNISCMAFRRSKANQDTCNAVIREQTNTATHYLDGSGIYGSSSNEAMMLRIFRGGEVVEDVNATSRTQNEAEDAAFSDLMNPTLNAMHQLWRRFHNRLARKFASMNPGWKDETLYQEARRVVVALIQQITYDEYLPLVLGHYATILKLRPLKEGYLSSYSPEIDASVTNAFATTALRFAHSMMAESFKIGLENQPQLLNYYSKDPLHGKDLSLFLIGLAKSPADPVDTIYTAALHNSFTASSGKRVAWDLYALDIQRGRDHGIPGYTEWRRSCGLPPITTFDDLVQVMPTRAAIIFQQLYSNVADIDLLPAGLAEFKIPGGIVGPTFACILGGQFLYTRRGDRFWYENNVLVTPMTKAQLTSIRNMNMWSVLCHLDTERNFQPYPFYVPDLHRNAEHPCNEKKLNLEPWRETARQPPSPHPVPVSLPPPPPPPAPAKTHGTARTPSTRTPSLPNNVTKSPENFPHPPEPNKSPHSQSPPSWPMVPIYPLWWPNPNTALPSTPQVSYSVPVTYMASSSPSQVPLVPLTYGGYSMADNFSPPADSTLVTDISHLGGLPAVGTPPEASHTAVDYSQSGGQQVYFLATPTSDMPFVDGPVLQPLYDSSPQGTLELWYMNDVPFQSVFELGPELDISVQTPVQLEAAPDASLQSSLELWYMSNLPYQSPPELGSVPDMILQHPIELVSVPDMPFQSPFELDSLYGVPLGSSLEFWYMNGMPSQSPLQLGQSPGMSLVPDLSVSGGSPLGQEVPYITAPSVPASPVSPVDSGPPGAMPGMPLSSSAGMSMAYSPPTPSSGYPHFNAFSPAPAPSMSHPGGPNPSHDSPPSLHAVKYMSDYLRPFHHSSSAYSYGRYPSH